MIWKNLWNRIKELWMDERGAFPIAALLMAGSSLLGKGIEAGSSKKGREWEAEQAEKEWYQQLGLSQSQDVLGAQTSEEYAQALQGLKPYQAYQYTAPDEATYQRLQELGIADIMKSGREASQAQGEQLAAMGIGQSSMGMGAQQNLAQRYAGEIGRSNLGYMAQAAARQQQYEQLMAGEQARAGESQNQITQILAEASSKPTVEETLAPYKAMAVEQYRKYNKVLPGWTASNGRLSYSGG